MAGFKSGLSYDQLRAIVDAGGVEILSKGTIKKNGPSWQAVLTYRNADSKRIYLTHKLEGAKSRGRDATTKTSARGMLADWRGSVVDDVRAVAGISVDPTSTVRACIEKYVDDRVALGKIRQSTATYYRNAAKRIYRYPFANQPINALTQPIVQVWVNDLAKTLSGKSVKASFDLLDAVCKKVLGYDHNPCKRGEGGIELPRLSHNSKKRGGRPNALSFDGVATMNTLLDGREGAYDGIDQMAIAARLALHTGMRAEEVCGLRWRDVDLRSKTIHVRRVIERAEIPATDENGMPLRDGKGNIKVTYTEFESEPKSESSSRDIPLDSEIAGMLSAHRARVRTLVADLLPEFEGRQDLAVRPDVADLYVVGGPDGSFLSPYLLGKRWGKFSRSRGLLGTEGRAVTFHDLRHTAATRMLAAGIDVATVSHILGHAEVSVTLNRYTTSDERTKREAVNAMADVFSMRAPEGGGGVIPFRTGTDN